MTEQSEEEVEGEIVSGLLPFTVNGETRLVPERKWRANREWQALVQEAFVRLTTVPGDTPDGIVAMADTERELVLAYDSTHVLGDLEDATDREVDAIYTRLMEVSYPLAQSQTALVVALLRAAASAQASSTSGPSPSGTIAALPTSRTRSRTARSSSSTARRKSA